MGRKRCKSETDAAHWKLMIKSDGGTDVFAHHTAIVGDGFKSLKENERVSFEVEQGPKGPKAINIVKL